MQKKLLFNPDGTRDLKYQRLVGGKSTNLIEFANVKYDWAEQLYRKMRQFFWIPDEVPLGDDKRQYPKLTEAEQTAYKKTLAFLIFLDSIQVDNLGALALYITAPEVVACLKTQAFFETIHAQSYDYLLTSVVDSIRLVDLPPTSLWYFKSLVPSGLNNNFFCITCHLRPGMIHMLPL